MANVRLRMSGATPSASSSHVDAAGGERCEGRAPGSHEYGVLAAVHLSQSIGGPTFDSCMHALLLPLPLWARSEAHLVPDIRALIRMLLCTLSLNRKHHVFQVKISDSRQRN